MKRVSSPAARRRRVPHVRLLAFVAVLAACTSVAVAAASTSRPTSLAGTWSGHYSGAYNGTFTLHWTQSGSRLSGKIKLSRPPGTYPITGSVRGKTINFGAVGAGATYTGTVSGNSMSGTYKTGRTGGSWSATKTS